MKSINVKPVESIEFKFPGGETYVCTFNMLAMAYMQEGLSDVDGRLDELSTAHLVSLMLYAGIKANDEKFTMDEAKQLALSLDPSCYSEIIDSYTNSVMGSMDKKEAAKLKKAMIQYLSIVRKSTSA